MNNIPQSSQFEAFLGETSIVEPKNDYGIGFFVQAGGRNCLKSEKAEYGKIWVWMFSK